MNAPSNSDLEKYDYPGINTSTERPNPFEVTLEPHDDPKTLPLWRKWIAALVVNTGAICVTGASSMAAVAEVGVSQEFHVLTEVATIPVTLFLIGLGIGPLLVRPLAAVLGQRPVYLASFALLFASTFLVAFSQSIALHVIFRFLGGLSGSAFLSIGGATISDLFTDEEVATPMAMYTISTFIGPVLTPIFSGFIYQNAGWRWEYYVLIMWEFVQMLLLLLVPETAVSVILKRKAEQLRDSTGETRYYAPSEVQDTNLLKSIRIGMCHIFELVIYDRMALLLDIWLSLILGILYLVFQVFPIIFQGLHGFNPQEIGLTFLGVGTGLVMAMCSQVFWNHIQTDVTSENNNNSPPEVWLTMGKVGGILIPVSLYCLAFTTYQHVHWIVPIISTVPFGVGICFVYTSTFMYLVTAFRPMAAAALTGNAVMRTTFAAAFPLFSNTMYAQMGTVGATAFLAGLMTLMAPLPFVFDKIGAQLRQKSPFATHF